MVLDSLSVGGAVTGAPVASGAPAYLGARTLDGSGDKMAIGVSRRSVRPLVLGRLSSGLAATGLPGAGRGSSVGRARDAGPARVGQAAGASTSSPRLRRVWWQRRASLGATDSNASWPSR